MIKCHQKLLLSIAMVIALPLTAADIAPVGKARVETASEKAPASVPVTPERPADSATTAQAAAPEKKPATTTKTPDAKATQKPVPKVSPNKVQTATGARTGRKLAYTGPNSFNRLMKPPSQRNLPPAKDGIHDPKNDGTLILQAPRDSFDPLPKASSGNRVDWVSALESGDLNPRYDRLDPDKVPIVLDLNIVREVKGSMPDVVYPHKQHTEWLDCSNCHPAIFIPMKGANNISMASILLGEKCGVCHGKVAFPVSECRKCHSKNKTE